MDIRANTAACLGLLLVGCSLTGLDQLSEGAPDASATGARGGGAGTGGGSSGTGGGSSGTGGLGATGGTSGGGGTAATGGGGAGNAGASGGGAGGTASGGSGGSAGVQTTGCSDGTREAFLTAADIAGCSGGWSVPGVVTAESMSPACGYQSGNDSLNPPGTGCSVADLCEQGWHVCASAAEVAAASPSGCESPPNALFLTRQGMATSSTVCQPPPADNNVVGCGRGVGQPATASCNPLNRMLLLADCVAPWNCANALDAEGSTIVKSGPEQGGVLCCRD